MISYKKTDLALERCRSVPAPIRGIETKEESRDGVQVHTVKVLTEKAARSIGKPPGTYVTVEYDRTFQSPKTYGTAVQCLADALRSFLPPSYGTVFCVGLGNPHLAADAFGPAVIDGLLVTHHIKQYDRTLFDALGLRDVAALCPGVLGQTGLESADIISAAVEKIKPDVVLLSDALAALDKKRLCSTVQIGNTGITPGSGIGNKRLALSEETLGVPVLSLGVPTVIRAAKLCDNAEKDKDGEDLIVTPKDIDTLVSRAARLTAEALNRVLQPSLTKEDLYWLKA